MHPSMTFSDPLTAKLAGAMIALMKGSQHEVMEITADFDLTLSQMRILFVAEHAEQALAVNEIADRLSLSMAATGRAIDGMHRMGLVFRREDEADRRVKRITLTDEGTSLTGRIAAARAHAVQAVVDGLSDEERAQLDVVADTLTAVLANHLPLPDVLCVSPPPGAAESQPVPARSEPTS